ncbi:hypothetical protein NOVO_03320 [Rickettsiales bacterium Ac37b]|nr:hypothetical protein NOVO_03320 [Rickettsiales bacterium Ac37b]
MVGTEKINISADLARVLNNNRQTLNLHPRFSIIGVQIALRDEFIQERNIKKEVVVGLMAGMIASVSNADNESKLDNTMLLKAIQKAAVKIAQDSNNASLTQAQAMTLGKAWVDKGTQKALLSSTRTSIEQLTATLMHVKHNTSFDKIINPELQQQIHKAFQKNTVSSSNNHTMTPDKGRSL